MKVNQWTLGLAAAGVVSLASTVQAEEAKQAISSALSSTTLSGYVDTSAIWRLGTSAGAIAGRSYDGAAKQDGFNLNVVKVTLEKPLDEGQWAAGYKVDLLFGPDAGVFGGANGVFTANSAIKQAYVQLRAPVGNGLDFKMGVFDTILGYEVFDAGNNPNYSRSYGYFLEPTTYTGILASYRVSDIISLSAGVADAGAAGGINGRSTTESIKSYMASVALTAPKDWGFLKGSTLYAGVVDHGQGTAAVHDTVNLYVGGTLATPVAGLSVGASYDYRGTPERGGNSGNWANAVALYASFKATDKLTLNARGEYAWADAGAASFSTFGKFGSSADSEKFLSGTFTADYALWANVISRVELRWDHDAAGGVPVYTGATGSPLRNVVSVALNVIYKF